MITHAELLASLNNSGLHEQLSHLRLALIAKASASLGPETAAQQTPEEQCRLMLNSVGPAAAEAAVSYTINHYRQAGKSTADFNGSITNNFRLLMNIGEFPDSTSVLRQFLLPRYAYLDFDSIVDPRHRIDEECGYPKFITPIMYRYMYDRDDIASRINDIYPDEAWAAEPQVYEQEDENKSTGFEADWQRLCDTYNINQYLYRISKLATIGHYGAMLIGVDDGADLEKPIDEPALLAGIRRTVGQPRQLLYLRPFDEYLSFIHQYETDVMHPRYGLPKFYNLIFQDMTIDAAGASIGTRLNRRVHWTRVIHVANDLMSSLVFGRPSTQSVFNRLLDLRKVKGGSAEMFWKGAFPGYSFEIDPQFVADNPQFDENEFRQEIENYSNGLQRYLRMLGVSVKSLAPQVASPKDHVMIQMQAIATNKGIPLRILLGSEEGRLASAQDKLTWNGRLGRYCRMFLDPAVVRATVDRFIALGIIRPPESGRYFTSWGNLDAMTDDDKANLAIKWSQALSQYVSSGMIHLIQPLDYLTMILGLRVSDAKHIVAQVGKSGGWAKLKAVDPSQGSGVNGVAQNNVSKGDRQGKSSKRADKRSSADKQLEGSTS